MELKKQDKKKLILEGDMYRAIFVISFPIMVNNLIQTLYSLADAIWVSKLGSVEFAATSFVWPVNFLFISIGFGIFIAASSILSQLVGADKIDEASEYASQLIVLSMILSIIFGVLGYLSAETIVGMMGADGYFKEQSVTYLKWTFLEVPFMFLFFNINSIMSAEGNTLTPTILSGISAILNAILDPIFIFNLDLKIAGAAIATIISRALITVIGGIVIMKRDNLIKPNFKDFKFDKEKIRKIFRVALPSSIGQSGSAVGFIVLNKFIAVHGTATLAAFGMVNRITGMITQVTGGIGAGLTTIIGQNLGARKDDRAMEAFMKASKATISMGIVGCIVILLNKQAMLSIFVESSTSQEVVVQALEYLTYSALIVPLMGMFNVFTGLFQGSGHTKYAMQMEVGRLWFVRIPMILLFNKFTDLGSTGIWISMTASNLIICIYAYIIYRRGFWRQTVMTS